MTKLGGNMRRLGSDPYETFKQLCEKRIEDLEKAVYIYGIGEDKAVE